MTEAEELPETPQGHQGDTMHTVTVRTVAEGAKGALMRSCVAGDKITALWLRALADELDPRACTSVYDITL